MPRSLPEGPTMSDVESLFDSDDETKKRPAVDDGEGITDNRHLMNISPTVIQIPHLLCSSLSNMLICIQMSITLERSRRT